MGTVRTWDFVEEFYPNYHGSDEIAENDVLQRIVDNEIEGDSEREFRNIGEELGFDCSVIDIEKMSEEDVKQIQYEAGERLKLSNEKVYERSIEMYLLDKDELLLNTDLKVLEEIVFVKKYGRTESELGMLLRLGGVVSVNNQKDVDLANRNGCTWSSKYKRWFVQGSFSDQELIILKNIL